MKHKKEIESGKKLESLLSLHIEEGLNQCFTVVDKFGKVFYGPTTKEVAQASLFYHKKG